MRIQSIKQSQLSEDILERFLFSFVSYDEQMRKLQDVHNGNYCFAMDGQSFELLRIHDPTLFQTCIHRSKVFARMAPDHKQHLIEALQKIG